MRKRGPSMPMVSAVIIAATLMVGTAAAEPGGAQGSRAGGIKLCEEALGACETNVGVCQTELDAVGADLATCDSNLETCTGERASCESDLAACEATQGAVFPGDGAGSGPPLAYEECIDGLTVADLNTGLLWEKKRFGGSSDACLSAPHGVSSFCAWLQTSAWVDVVNSEGGRGYAGFNDWRMPNVKELQSIVDYSLSAYSGVPTISPKFGPTTPGPYWSVTTDSWDPSDAWWVGFGRGSVSVSSKLGNGFVRAVRNGSCASCSGGTADCDGIPMTGCETDLYADPENCGACGNACELVCVDGVCDPI